MKKRIILIILLILLSFILCACSTNVTSGRKIEADSGKYHCEGTRNPEDVVRFLNNLDETKYEVVEIIADGGGYVIFYKDID